MMKLTSLFELRSTVPAVLAAAASLAACGDDGGGAGGGPDGGVPFVYQCGPITCGLDQACVWDPGTTGRETYRCVEDITCGLEAFIRCNEECSPPGSPPDRECERGCQTQFRETTLHYGCPPNPAGDCVENIQFPILSSPVVDEDGEPLDPRPRGDDDPEPRPGIYEATFMACQLAPP